MKKYMLPPGFKPSFFSIFYSILHKPKKLSVDIFDTYYLPKAHFFAGSNTRNVPEKDRNVQKKSPSFKHYRKRSYEEQRYL